MNKKQLGLLFKGLGDAAVKYGFDKQKAQEKVDAEGQKRSDMQFQSDLTGQREQDNTRLAASLRTPKEKPAPKPIPLEDRVMGYLDGTYAPKTPAEKDYLESTVHLHLKALGGKELSPSEQHQAMINEAMRMLPANDPRLQEYVGLKDKSKEPGFNDYAAFHQRAVTAAQGDPVDPAQTMHDFLQLQKIYGDSTGQNHFPDVGHPGINAYNNTVTGKIIGPPPSETSQQQPPPPKESQSQTSTTGISKDSPMPKGWKLGQKAWDEYKTMKGLQ